MGVTYLLIIILLLFGAWLLYCRKKRKFDRMNEHGVEVFGSFNEKAKAEVFDTLLIWAGYACFISGVLVLMGISYTVFGWLFFAIVAIYLIRNNHYRQK